MKESLMIISILASFGLCIYVNPVVDLSHHQNHVDFKEVKRDGIFGVIHKATQGNWYKDPMYKERRVQAEKEGLLWGAYHFAQAGEPKAQADFYLSTVNITKGALLVLDLELYKNKSMTPDEAEVFVLRIKEVTGRYPILYGGRYFLKDFNKEHLNKCHLWIAMFSGLPEPKLPHFRKSWVLWQYTDGRIGGTPRTVKGIGPCDRDRYNGTVEQLVKLWPDL